MIEVFIYFLLIALLIMFEIPQVICRGILQLIYLLNEPYYDKPKVCKHCGDILSITPFRIKRGKDNKIVWWKYKCFKCGIIHKVMR